jgi:hypothetical protein
MDTLVLNVTPRGNGFVAVGRRPALTAVGPSPAEAVEDGRLFALALYGKGPRPRTLIARINEPGVSPIVMQPVDKVFEAFGNAEKSGWRYVASARGAAQKVAQ